MHECMCHRAKVRIFGGFGSLCPIETQSDHQAISGEKERPHTETGMDEEEIGLVLARATELRMKISNCVQKVTTGTEPPTMPMGSVEVTETQQGEDGNGGYPRNEKEAEDEKTEDEDAEKLLNICDSLETLEFQLSSLQDLQQKRRYEREVALAEIENSRKLLLDKLKKYNGKQLEVIGEASAFAGETVEHKYVTCVSEIQTAERHVRNGLTSEPKKCLSESEKNQAHNRTSSSRKGLRYLAISATLVGVVTILSLSGLGPNFVKKGFRFNFMSMFQRETGGNSTIDCPQGKIQVMENGENICLLKERMEVPLSAVSSKPHLNYGCG